MLAQSCTVPGPRTHPLQGYSGVADYKMADAVPDVTVLPASGQTCETTGNNPGGCNTFDYILCGAPSS